MKTIYYYLLILYLFSSCNKSPNIYSNNINIFSFHSPITLSYDTIFQMPIGFEDVYIIDSLLLYITNQPNKLFQIYSENKNLASFGTKGKGPNEFLSISYNGQFSKTGNNIIFWINNIMKKELNAINLSQSIEKNTICISQKIRLPQISNNSIILSDSTIFLTIEDYNTNTISNIFYNHLTQKQKIQSLYQATKQDLQQTYGSIWEYNPYKKCLVTAMPSINQINFLYWENNQKYALTSGSLKDNTIESINQRPQNTTPYYYGRATTNSRYIYILHSENQKGKKAISVFDWERGLIKTLYTPESLSGIRVDSKNHYLYGFIYETEKIYKYKLPQL